ncbi:hypothetical protein ACF3NA_08985 [Alkanindiges sp. WGS2144]|uniref:hypothetical protein n=1 Tax=Alkanindiges sp. WGS2144 TaxID=3366808 RepID=UPI0037533CB2
MIWVALNIIFAFLIANYAEHKGQSFIFWCLLSLIFTPVVGLITLLGILFVKKNFGRNRKNINY